MNTLKMTQKFYNHYYTRLIRFVLISWAVQYKISILLDRFVGMDLCRMSQKNYLLRIATTKTDTIS